MHYIGPPRTTTTTRREGERKCATGFLLFRHKVWLLCNRQSGSVSCLLTQTHQTKVSQTKAKLNQSLALVKPPAWLLFSTFCLLTDRANQIKLC